MTKIGLLSDTHGWLDEKVFTHFKQCDEVWHAGDFGSIEITNQLRNWPATAGKKPIVRGVWGNIDGKDVRSEFKEVLAFRCEEVPVYITHIGGYPGKYAPGVKAALLENGARLFICGHSHILKIMYDDKIDCLHINPGAAGKQGWHKVRTLVTFTIDGANIKDCAVIELGAK